MSVAVPGPIAAVAVRSVTTHRSSGARLLRRPAYPLVVVFFALYAALSVQQHRRMETTGFDLGIFEQSVRAYASGRWPVSPLRGLNLLGDHFSPIVALLAPIYRLVPSPYTLLLAQALLLALSVLPVARLAQRRYGAGTAWCVGTAYGLSWGLQNTVAFDFHEICFAVPLLAFAGEALALGRWHRAAVWALPLILVKEDLPLTVAVVGGYLFWRGSRRLGAAVAAVGLTSFALIVFVVLPAVNPRHRYEYLSALPTTGSAPPLDPDKLGTLAITLGWLLLPTALLALRSPLLLLAVPTLAWRFASTNPQHWGTGYHYSAVLMPIVAVAFLDALDRSGGRLIRRAAVALALVVAVAHTGQLPMHRLVVPAFWNLPARTVHAGQLLAMIPDGARVAASNRLAPQLTRRCDVRLFPAASPSDVTAEWVVADAERREWPTTVRGMRHDLAWLQANGYDLVAGRDGFVLLRRRA